MYRLVAALIRLFLGVLYPGYQTFKLLNSGLGLTQVPKYQKMLKFWLVMAVFLSVEFFSDTLLFWFPFYYEFKLVLLVYITFPQFQGYITLYEKYIVTKLKENEFEIDLQIEAICGLYQKFLDTFYSNSQNYLFKIWQTLEVKAREFLLHRQDFNNFSSSKDNLASSNRNVILNTDKENYSDTHPSNSKADTSLNNSKVGSQSRTWFDEVTSLVNLMPTTSDQVSSNSKQKNGYSDFTEVELKANRSGPIKTGAGSRLRDFQREQDFSNTSFKDISRASSEPPAYSMLDSGARNHPNRMLRPRNYGDFNQEIRKRTGN